MFWTDIVRFLQYFRNLSNTFTNIFAILQDFHGIFSKYSFNITVLCGSDFRNFYTLGTKIKGSPVFFIKYVSILNGHNFGPERLYRDLKKKQFEVGSVDFANLWAKFCKVLKIRGYVAQQPKW